MHQWSRVSRFLYSALLSGQFKEFGRGTKITRPFRFYGLNQICLGESVSIERNCWIQVVNQDGEEQVTKLWIKSHAGIGMGASISAAKQIIIGEHVLLGRNVYISDHAHAFNDVNSPIMNQGIDNVQPVSIGKRSWLGQNVVILPGGSVGEHCVIGANSVVNRPIPDFSVAVGAPARVVRSYDAQTKQWVSVGLKDKPRNS